LEKSEWGEHAHKIRKIKNNGRKQNNASINNIKKILRHLFCAAPPEKKLLKRT